MSISLSGKRREDHGAGGSQAPVLALCPNSKETVECAKCRVRALSLCDALEPAELVDLDRMATSVAVGAKETLFEQDQPSEAVYNVTAGSVRLYKLLPDGRRQVVGFALPGDFLGLSMSDRNAFSADALTPTTACRFSRQEYSAFLDAKPHLLRRLHSMASHELSLAQDQMVILGRRTAEERIAAFLIGLRNRWMRINGNQVHVPLPMTRQDIGDFLGLTVETVSRLMTRLAREKAIVIVPDGVRLLDVPRLERLAEI
ncbi:MAG: helix-turn-helix domain-containing protein [Beijerinckiaceae bacterium]|nr:helix-turn-helix domain-containing protein [Beijerinckiaceae bacterium]